MPAIDYVIRARDATAKAWRAVSSGAKRMAKGINAAGRSVGRAFKGMKKIAAGTAAAIGLVAVAVFAAGKKAVAAYQVQAQAEAKLEAILKSTGFTAGFTSGEIRKQAAELQKLTGVGDETIISMQGMLASFKQIRGDNFQRATVAVLDMGAAMKKAGADTSEVEQQSIQVGKALNDPIKGLSALSRVGVTFTEQQKQNIQAMQEQGDVAGAQAIILGELESEFGGTAAAMNKATHGITNLKNVFGDTIEKVGQAIVETKGFDDIIATVTRKLEELAESGYIELWAENVKRALEFVAPGFKKVGGAFDFVKRKIQEGAAFAGGFAGGQGSFQERLVAGFDMAREIPGTLKKDEEDRLKTIRAERAAKKAAKEEAEKAAFIEGTAARIAREKLAAEEKTLLTLKQQAQVKKLKAEIAAKEEQIAEKQLAAEIGMFNAAEAVQRQKLDAPEEKNLRQRLQLTAKEQAAELDKIALTKEERRAQEALRRDVADDAKREERLGLKRLRGAKLSREDEAFLAARRAAEQRGVELANIKARENIQEQREIRKLKAAEDAVVLLRDNLRRVGN